MARVHSPGYPQFGLQKAVAAVKRIFDQDRRSAISRDAAAKHIGYSGQSGAADKALATLAHFGLLEKAGKGETRVTPLAVEIIAPDNDDAKKAALVEAAFSPQIFADLRERFGTVFSETALESYLLRANFQNIAIRPVIKSYSETCLFLEQEKVFESGGNAIAEGGESDLRNSSQENEIVNAVAQAAPMPAATTVPPTALAQGENEWMRNQVGRETKVRLLVTGDMGPKEIGRLIKLLEAQKAVLDDDDEINPFD